MTVLKSARPVSPLSAVRGAVSAGASSVSEISDATGLNPLTVQAILDSFERAGQGVRSCSGSACKDCALAKGCDHAAGSSDASGGAAKRGLVMLTLTKRAC